MKPSQKHSDAIFYQIAADEVRKGTVDEGLLAKAAVKAEGDKKKAEAELNATLANLTLPPKSTDPWDMDPGGLPAPGGGPELVVVHRSNLAYVGVEFRAV